MSGHEHNTQPDVPNEDIRAFVLKSGLVRLDSSLKYTALSGGVASDIWLVENGGISFCIKRALSRLRVQADWRAPVERNRYEVRWLRGAARAMPDAVPAILADDPAGAMFAMEYLPPARFVWWKGELLAGRVDHAAAAMVGERLVRIHAAFASDPESAALFPTDEIFHAIRLEPYLLATAEKHPDLAARLVELVALTLAAKRTAIHGDVSPKNILIGPQGPVFLDAECAWFGDPAFDLAFCLNHLLLKCLAARHAADQLLAAFQVLAGTYLRGIDWEPADELEGRAAALLPGLFLARVDGKSPVEYLTEDRDRDRIRRVARAFLRQPSARLSDISALWAREIGAEPA